MIILSLTLSKDFTGSALETRRTCDIPSRVNNATRVADDTNLVNVLYVHDSWESRNSIQDRIEASVNDRYIYLRIGSFFFFGQVYACAHFQ